MGTENALWSALDLSTPTSSAGLDGHDGYQRFSTGGLQVLDRIELWERHNANALIELACRSIDGRMLDATEVNLRLDRLNFAGVGASAHIVERTHRHIATTATDGVALYFSLAGDAFFYHQDGVHLQRPGTLLVCDVNQPFLRGFAHGLQEYVLTIPRSVYEEVAERSLPRTPMVVKFSDVPGGDTNAAALAHLIRRSLADPGRAPVEATEWSALELLRALLNSTGAGSAAARRQAAVAWISRNLRDPSMSVATVATAIGVSERHLARAFVESGVGVARTILDMRLDLAHRILSGSASPSVHEVAAYCGFVSAAHFSRVFRERYEQTPAEVRAGRTGSS
jgi:AraC-like DNA-binding protein